MTKDSLNHIKDLKQFVGPIDIAQRDFLDGSSMPDFSKSLGLEVEDMKQFSIREKKGNTPKFPFHHYLRQHYTRLSLQQQIHIFKWYFKCSKKKSKKIVLQTSHIQILNEGLNLFTKLPEEPFLFLLIQQYDQSKQIMTIKDQKGEVFHFQVLEQNKKRCTIIGQIKRKLKGRGFIIINDKSKLSQVINKKTLNKLAVHSNYFYLRYIKNKKQFDNLKVQFFPTSNIQQSSEYFQKINLQNEKTAIINLTNEKFYAYSHSEDKKINYQDYTNLKIQYFQQFQSLILQENQLIYSDTRAFQCNVRLRIFDYLYINFLKSFNNKKQYFFYIVQKMTKRLAIKLDSGIETEKDHYPQKIFNSRRCKCCEVLDRGKNKKSKYKCIGCSIKNQADVPLCISCFGDFHEEILPNCGMSIGKNLKKSYQNYLKKRNSQSTNMLEANKQIEKNIESKEQVRDAILKLNENMNQIQKMMEQLQEHSFFGAKIVKQMNQALFVGIIKSFNSVIEYDIQFQSSKRNDRSKVQIQEVSPSNALDAIQNP